MFLIGFFTKKYIFLSSVAHEEHQSSVSLVQDLALEAVETREHHALSEIDGNSDTHSAKAYSHP